MGTLYVGVTTNLVRRVFEHRERRFEGFTKRHKLSMLVYFEGHDSIIAAIQREKTVKTWLRAWKVRLILERNPGWTDLYPIIV